ncbi:hypothetical protein EYF80_044658 [Liparis tanakae]|uniref:Uncharacterized protein n=1 Tax=Liparis tanakae TaxID=230148 RepID=A0A4Z2FVB0_9TELE|nr:hypothetical protein EYF80_044658 [Liparis tanakae]
MTCHSQSRLDLIKLMKPTESHLKPTGDAFHVSDADRLANPPDATARKNDIWCYLNDVVQSRVIFPKSKLPPWFPTRRPRPGTGPPAPVRGRRARFPRRPA